MIISMDNNCNTPFVKSIDDTQTIVKNINKLRVGIMLDSYCLEGWDYKMLESIIQSEYASIELVILNESGKEKKSYRDKILSNRNILLYLAYTKLEDWINQPIPAFIQMGAQNLLKNVPVIGIKPKMDKYSDWIQEPDIESIKESNLDVIIRRGFRILKGDILKAAKYGVWSYHHDDNAVIRGRPPGFWETFERMGERGVILQLLTEDLDNGIVLYRSYFPCYFSYVNENNNHCFLRSSLFVPRTLKKLFSEGEKAFLANIENENKKLNFYNRALFRPPTNFLFLPMLTKQAIYLSTQFIRLQFFQRHWFLMYDLQDQISTSFWRFKKIIPPRDRFWADPHVFFKDDIY
jgi:hypothetical protein